MLMHALEVLCNEPWCCIFCWQYGMQFSYATHLAHPVWFRPTYLNISGYASGTTYSMSFKLVSVVCTWLYLLSVEWVQYGEVAAVGQREDNDFPRMVESRSSSDVQLTVLSRDDWWHHVP